MNVGQHQLAVGRGDIQNVKETLCAFPPATPLG